ncbi:MAG TPA: GvpL/GvpF family gas vesicle protein [Gemmatimonadaceae bacterium]|nr:GvpL/GvpF family gas vesicle protein [Gemmatimonadaceae bacterium]
MTALEFLGLMAVAHDDVTPLAPGVTAIRVRELGAVVRAAPAEPYDPATDNGEYEQLLDALFARGAVFPAPPGMVFRTAETLRAWVEQNYIGLAEGLSFISGRCEARVHVRPAGHVSTPDSIAAATLEAHDAIRALRHGAVATVNIPEPQAPVLLSVAFLLKTNEWNTFGEAVLEQERRFGELRFEQTGPWIPHDFVRLDLGV